MKALVIVVRGLQLGALGCYGNQWGDTPTLDGLAAEGVVFDQHFADAADPSGARRAWRSGRYCLPGTAPASDNGESDLLAALRRRKIHTCLIVDESRPSAGDFALGWDVVQRVAGGEEMTPLEEALEAAGTILEQLEQSDDWLLWIDLGMLLPPWDVPPEYLEPYFNQESTEQDEEETNEPLTPIRDVIDGPIDAEDDALFVTLQSSYAAVVAYLDAGLRPLLQALVGLQGGDDVLLLLTTDVGCSLGEHGVVGSIHAWPNEEVVHLPLLMRLPGGAEAGRRISTITQAVDVAATLADWFAASLLEAHGRSLLPLARGEGQAIRPYACIGRQVGDAVAYALRTPQWAFLLPMQAGSNDAPRSPCLYVKPEDRCEVNDVSQHHLDLVEQLERIVREFVTATCRAGALKAFPAMPADFSR